MAIEPTSASLRGRLSERALRALDDQGVTRDTSLSCEPEVLRATLTRYGLPAYPAVLDLERLAGGVTLGGAVILGACAALRQFDGSPHLKREDFFQVEGRPLVPVDGSVMPSLWMDEDGAIFRGYRGRWGGDPDPDSDDLVPAYESLTKLFERYVLDIEACWPPHSPKHEPRFEVSVQAPLGERFAELIGAKDDALASDRYGHIWLKEDASIAEMVAAPLVDTRARLAALDDVVACLVAAAQEAPGRWVRWGKPILPEPRAGEEPIHRLAQYDSWGKQTHWLLIYGGPGDYRFETAPV